jgi:hypothetical protein
METKGPNQGILESWIAGDLAENRTEHESKLYYRFLLNMTRNSSVGVAMGLDGQGFYSQQGQ